MGHTPVILILGKEEHEDLDFKPSSNTKEIQGQPELHKSLSQSNHLLKTKITLLGVVTHLESTHHEAGAG